MKKSSIFLLFGLCVAGFSSGFAAKRLANGPPPSSAAVVEEKPAEVGRNAPTARESGETSAVAPASLPSPSSHLQSTDTLESLLAADDRSIFGRLSLWMMDASEEEISAYWQNYRQRENRQNDVNDLIFINWTRLNPLAATAAANGTPDAHYAWWAWACHDPQAALAAAVSGNPEHIGNVGWGLGEFHGDWCRENWDDLPEAARGRIIGGMTKWDDAANPQEILDFLKEKGQGFNQRLFQSMVRKDPWAAYDWLQENSGIVAGSYGNSDRAFESVLQSLGESQPGALERLAAQTPSGETKRKIEAAAFKQLLETDPDAALKQAKAEKAPLIAAERLAAVGLSLAKTDPEKAFELVEDLFAADPGGTSGTIRIRYPSGSSSSGATATGVNELMDALLAKDPGKLLDISPLGSSPHGRDHFYTNASKWAELDLPAYAEWVTEKSDPAIRDRATGVVVNELRQGGHFAEAADWALSSQVTQSHLQGVFHDWYRNNGHEAAEWLESADLPDDQRTHLNRILESNLNQ